MDVRYQGWTQFTDSGDYYRWWTFESEAEALGAAKGDRLLDRGPDAPKTKRFQVRPPGSSEAKARHSLTKVQKALGWDLPAWRPPREADLTMTKALSALSDAMKEVGRAIDRADTNRRALQEIQKVVDGTGKSPAQPGTQQNQYLRLKGKYNYDNGDPYTDFELLVDVPEIPVTRTDGIDPMHAAAGDVLRERYEDELTPFELRRNGRRIGDPEWWQLRHLFVGLKGHEPGEEEDGGNGEQDRPHKDLRYLHRLSPAEPERYTHCFRATRSIPGTIVAQGDFLTFSTDRYQRTDPAVMGAIALRVPRAQLPAVDEHFASLHVLHVQFNPKYTTSTRQLGRVRSYLSRKPNPKWQDSTSPLIVIRPLVAPISEPISAHSDDAALFELLCQVGGRMPLEA